MIIFFIFLFFYSLIATVQLPQKNIIMSGQEVPEKQNDFDKNYCSSLSGSLKIRHNLYSYRIGGQ